MSWSKIFKSIKPAIRERVSRQSAWLDTKKHLLADHLQKKSEKLSTAQKKTWTILFMFFGMALCGHIVYTGFLGKHQTNLNLPRGRISNGTVLRMGESMESLRQASAIRNLMRFKHYMDSLKSIPEGQRLYDSLTSGRPGMMDSLNYIINNQ